MNKFAPLVINKRTRVPYEYLGNNTFRNLHTNAEGKLSDEQCAAVFSIPVGLNLIAEKNPQLIEAIKKLKLFLE